jgi:Ino eighty subunit 1
MSFYPAISPRLHRASRLQGTQRNRTLAVKHQDGEPLTRVDLQYDLLYYLFTDPNKVFTDPYLTLHGDPAGTKVTFRDLYVNTLLHSPRCSKVSREKLQDNPEFADEFAKIALLSNVGRINTTMACKYASSICSTVRQGVPFLVVNARR